MGYPDLMFFEPQSAGYIVDGCVFEDMKLGALIGRADVADAMRKICSPRNILARQEMFYAMADPALENRLQLLSADMAQAVSLARQFEKARCPAERHIIYISLAGALIKFFADAADTDALGETSKKASLPALLERFRGYFASRTGLENYKRLCADTAEVSPKVETALGGCYKISGNNLRISAEDKKSYMSRLLACSADLGLGGVRRPHMEPRPLDVSLIEATAKLYPEVFAAAAAFYEKHKNFYEPEVLYYKVEIDFYLVMAGVADRIKKAGIPLRFPKPAAEKKIDIVNAYDVTLLTKGETSIIPNDVYFDLREPFYYLTGANGGGKTTYLRTVGAACLLFLNGCAVPCDRAEIYPLSAVFTHFPRDERFGGGGRWAEEQQRVDDILDASEKLAGGGGCSLILLNETYSTTNEEKARRLTAALAEKLYDSGNFGVYVTHQHGTGQSLSEGSDRREIPCLNVLIDRSDSNRRTFKVARQKSVYSSYAYDILKKYALTKEELDRRFK